MVAWMAGVLYLPRLFVYHAAAVPGGELSETLKVMERRLLRAITVPAMLLTLGFGTWLAVMGNYFTEGWLHSKLTLVFIMAGYTGMLGKWRKDFARDANVKSATFYRVANEVPTLLLIAIVFIACVKPF